MINPRLKRILRHHLPLWIVVVAGTVFSVALFLLRRDAIADNQRAHFAEISHDYYRLFQRDLEVHLEALHALRDFMLSAPGNDRESFGAFTRASIERRPGLLALQWIPIVPREDREAVETMARADGLDTFAIRERAADGSLEPAGDRAVYFPVFHVEPLEENIAALGFDYGSDPIRSAALRHALERRVLVGSEPVRFIQDKEGEPGVLLLLPVIPPGDVEPVGLVSAALRLRPIVYALQPDQRDLLITLRDVTPGSTGQILVATPGAADAAAAGAHYAGYPIAIGSRHWTLEVKSLPRRAEGEAPPDDWLILIGGLILTGFTAAWVRERASYTATIEQQVGERTAALSRINESLQEQILHRQAAEEKLQRSEARFREAFQHAPIGIGLLSPEGRWLQVNEALAEMTGFAETELCGRTIGELLHPDNAERYLAVFAQMLAQRQETFAVEPLLRHTSGRSVWVLLNVSQVRDHDERLLYFICQIVDITERKTAVEDLRQAKEFSENIIRSSIDGILAFDRQARLTVWNSGMERMTGIPAEEALHKGATEVLPFLTSPEDDRAFRRVLAGAVVKATDRPFSIPERSRSGFYEAHYSPLHDSAGGIIGGVAVVRDVTEQKHARERLQNFTSLLRQRNRELQDFAYVASHDLQEPLRKIRAFGDRLAKRCGEQLDPQATDYLSRMLDASRRMQTLIDDLLSFSRVSTQTTPFQIVDLNQVAQGVLNDLEERASQGGAEIILSPLPTIEADPTQMRQLLQNLIGNALKYRKPDQPPRVEIFAREHTRDPAFPPMEGEGWLIYVRDNGIGFDEKYLDRIFTVFQRLHGRAEYEGTGIGLAICRRIVERHRGWITARSAPDQGATFIAALPLKQTG